MKKLIAVLLAVLMLAASAAALLGVAYACGEIPLPKIETGAEPLTGCAWFAIDETRHIAGKWDAEAREEYFTAPTMESPFILGLLENGVVRGKGEVKYTEAGGLLLGLTRLHCTIVIYAEYSALVAEIVEARTGEEITAASVVAASEWRTASTIYHVFFLPETPKAAIGVVWLNGGKNAATLYVGEFEGVLTLGFVTGGTGAIPEPETTPEPEPTPEPVIIRDTVYVRETVVREVVKEKTCIKVIQNNFQVNLNSTVTNCQKVILSGVGCNGKAVDCVKE